MELDVNLRIGELGYANSTIEHDSRGFAGQLEETEALAYVELAPDYPGSWRP